MKYKETTEDKYLLWESARQGNIKRIKQLIKKGVNLHSENDMALVQAAETGQLEAVKFLLDKGLKINTQLNAPLRFAASRGHLNVVKFLVENGADVHEINDEALEFAALNGHLEVVKFLEKNRSKLNNDYLLMETAERGKYNVVEYLLEKGADPNGYNASALKNAIKQGHYDIIKLLLEKGADVHLIKGNDAIPENESKLNKITKLLIKYGLNAKNNTSLIASAILNGDLELLRFLIKLGANVNPVKDYIYYYAARYGHKEMLDFLFKIKKFKKRIINGCNEILKEEKYESYNIDK
jgi:ankyrin repeat protein